MVVNDIRMKVNLRELVYQGVEFLVLDKFVHWFVHLKVLQDLVNIIRETTEVVIEVRSNFIGFTLQSLKVIVRIVEEGKTRFLLDDWRDIIQTTFLEFLVKRDNLILVGFNQTVQSSEDNKGENDIPILVRFEQPSQFIVTNSPNER
jgi:hypothetical protein